MKKNIKRVVMILMVLVVLVPFQGMAERHKSRVTYFSSKSFYVYAMASWVFDAPSEQAYWFEDDAAAPLLGLGYTLVNFGNRTLINLEFDAATAEFNFDLLDRTRVWFYTLALSMEYRFFLRLPLSAYAGFGGALLHYSYGEDEAVFAANAGLKIGLSKNLMLRAELRHYWKGWGYDEWDVYYEDDVVHFGTALSIGLELHF